MENGFIGIQEGVKCLREPIRLVNQRVFINTGMQMEPSRFQGGAKHGKWRYYLQNGEIDYIYLFRHDKLWKVDGRRVVRNRDSSRP